MQYIEMTIEVSVPIRGLFNLTIKMDDFDIEEEIYSFPSPLGDYLI